MWTRFNFFITIRRIPVWESRALPIIAKDGSGLAHELTRWRSETVGVTRLPALVPLLIGFLWIVIAVVVAFVA